MANRTINIRDETVYKVGRYMQLSKLVVYWALGNTCVYKCSYCPTYLHSGTLPYHDADAVLTIMKQLPTPSFVTFSGGEPTYHPNFEKIILEKPAHVKVGVITNGAKPLAFWEKVSPHLYRATFTFHPEYADVDRFIENVTIASKYIDQLDVFLVMHPKMWDYCKEVYSRLTTETTLNVLPKPVLESYSDAMGEVSSEYTKNQLNWIARRNREDNKINVFDKDGNVLYKTNPNELLALNQTDFRGFKCYVPMQHISISNKQVIHDAKCPQKSVIGHLTDAKLTLPSEPILCTQKFCKCQGDICADKIR